MMGFNASSLPADLPQTLGTLSDLITLLADPAAAKERVAEMQKASAEFREAIEASKAERAAFALAETAHQEALDKSATEHAAMLAANQTDFDTACAKTKSELDSRADELAQLQAKAREDAEAAAAIRADLETRIAHIKAATG